MIITSTSSAEPIGGTGIQQMSGGSPLPSGAFTDEAGVNIRYAKVTPGAISGGRGHFWMKRPSGRSNGASRLVSKNLSEKATCQFPDSCKLALREPPSARHARYTSLFPTLTDVQHFQVAARLPLPSPTAKRIACSAIACEFLLSRRLVPLPTFSRPTSIEHPPVEDAPSISLLLLRELDGLC